MQTCQGKTTSGAACRAHASAGGLCFFHANPDRAKRLGQIGGRKNRRVGVDLQIPDNATTADLRNLALQAIRLVFSGDMSARDAGALVQLCNFLCRVIPTADHEARMTLLEEQLKQEAIETSSDPDSGSPADGPEPDQTDARLEGEEQQEPPTFDAAADSEDAGMGSGNGSGEAEEA